MAKQIHAYIRTCNLFFSLKPLRTLLTRKSLTPPILVKPVVNHVLHMIDFIPTETQSKPYSTPTPTFFARNISSTFPIMTKKTI